MEELEGTGQSVVPSGAKSHSLLHAWISWVPHASKKGLAQVPSKAPRFRAEAPPHPILGWEGAPRHFLVPTGKPWVGH